MQYILDGDIHALSKDWAYICCETDAEVLNIFESPLSELREKFWKKYSEYLSLYDKMRFDIFFDDFLNLNSDDHHFIYRPAHYTGPLSTKGTFALKFRRAEKDNLSEM